MTVEDANAHIDPLAQAEADRWLVRMLDREERDPEWMEFACWRDTDPVHAAAYREAERLWRLGHEAARHPEMEQAARRILQPTRTVGFRPFHRRLVPALAIAAMLIVVFGLGALWWRATLPGQQVTHYATRVGQQRNVDLTDGSHVLLDTNSVMVVRYGPHAREVELLRGRAEFSVAHDADKPFVVRAGAGTVTDVGTRFQVSIGAHERVHVVLIRGEVDVATPHSNATLTQGEALRFDRSGMVRAPHAADLQEALGWTHGEVVVHDWPLSRVLAEMNRYSAVKVRIGDPSLDAARVTGSFRAGDQQMLVRILGAGWPIRAERESDSEIVLRRK